MEECKHCENKPLKCFPNTRREAPLAKGGQLPLGAALTAPMQASTFIPGGERLKMPCVGVRAREGAFLSAHAWPSSGGVILIVFSILESIVAFVSI